MRGGERQRAGHHRQPGDPGAVPQAPPELTRSREVDAYPLEKPSASDELDAILGERSMFDDTFGYYVHGVGPETAILPAGWQSRLVRVSNANTRDCIGWCLEVHDIAASKLAAGRPKDMEYLAALLRYGMVDVAVLRERLSALALSDERKTTLDRMLSRLIREAEERG
jgi:hypothetical protein